MDETQPFYDLITIRIITPSLAARIRPPGLSLLMPVPEPQNGQTLYVCVTEKLLKTMAVGSTNLLYDDDIVIFIIEGVKVPTSSAISFKEN